MIYFDENLINEKIAPHYGELVRIVKQAHNDFLKIPAMDGLDYGGLPYAVIMLVKIKDLLSHSYLIEKGIAEVVPFYSTFRLVFSGMPVSFNKVDRKKRKCKDVMEPNIMSFSEKYFKQESLFPETSDFNQHIISCQSPLTIGYTLKNVEIPNVYITHQIGKNVHWSADITSIYSPVINLQQQKNQANINTHKRRVHSKNRLQQRKEENNSN